MKIVFGLVLAAYCLTLAQGGADLSPRNISQDSTPYLLHYEFTGLRPDTGYYIKIRLKAPGGSYYGYTYNPHRERWLSQGSRWTDHPVARTNGSGNLSGWLFGRNGGHSPPAIDDSLQTVLRMVGSTTNTNPTVVPLVNIINMSTEGGWLYGHVYEDASCTRPYDNHHILAFRGSEIVAMYTTENNHVTEGYDSLNLGYVKLGVSTGPIDSIQGRDYSNRRVTIYTKTSPPWLIQTGDSTDIDLAYVAEQPIRGRPEKNITLTPNPATKRIAIAYRQDSRYKINIYDLYGRLICRLPEGTKEFTRDKLASGVYFFEFKTKQTKEVFSILFID